MNSCFDTIKYDEDQQDIQATLREEFMEVEKQVERMLPNGRSKAMIKTHLEEAFMWVGKALRDKQINVNAGKD